MVARALALVLVLLASRAHAASNEPPLQVRPPSPRLLHGLLIGAGGLAVAGAYTAGAFLTGDHTSARPLAITGGLVTGGLLGVTVALGLGSLRDDPGSVVAYILRPVLGGLIGAAMGAAFAGLGAWEPGGGRTATHVMIVGLIVTETLLLELARLL